MLQVKFLDVTLASDDGQHFHSHEIRQKIIDVTLASDDDQNFQAQKKTHIIISSRSH